jgi:hypothetical protein
MLAFPGMLLSAAAAAGMKAPSRKKADDYSFDNEKFPHFAVFCTLQLNRSMQPGEQFENAKIIAAIPVDKLKTMTLEDFLFAGLRYQQ